MSDDRLPPVLQGAKQIHIDPLALGMRFMFKALVVVLWFPCTGILLLDTKEKDRWLFLSFFLPGFVLVLGLARDLIESHDAWIWWIGGYLLLGVGLLTTLRLKNI